MGISLKFLVNLGILVSVATAASVVKKNAGFVNVLPPKSGVNAEDNALEIEIIPDDNGPWTHGILGLSLPSGVGYWTRCEVDDPSIYLCAQWGDFAQVLMRQGKDPNRCTRFEWTSTYAREIEDCYDITPEVKWYGGTENWYQKWPIESVQMNEGPYITGGFGGIVEHYWLISSGAALIIDPDTPLFYSVNTTHPNRICFKAKDDSPYTKRSPLKMNYEWCSGSDMKDAHQYAINNFFDRPSDIADEEVLVRPFWSTWAEYKEAVNQTLVLDYARRVISEGFVNSSHIQIDDDWETCYGDEEWNSQKFPDPKAMVDEVKAMDLRMTLWVHPFINYGCPRFDEAFQKGYFVRTPRGKPGITSWWQGENTGHIDVTNPEAAQWWSDRLKKIQSDTGMDSFKFDAGEAGLLPASPIFHGDDTSHWPLIYSTKYIEFVATFGGMAETRIAHRNQKQPMFIRMGDKDSRWGYDNGLKSMIPTLLQFGIVGYSFVLPDMIGGNAYNGEYPSKELYVRWMQVNSFMPSVQFSIVPWNYDPETVQICLDVLSQRERFREEILSAARQSVVDNSPINRPIWWVDPKDPVTHTIDDAYMMGDNILVAPVVEEGAVSRDIYLPVGTWTAGMDSSEVYTGPMWLRNYPAPLNVFPFFVKSA